MKQDARIDSRVPNAANSGNKPQSGRQVIGTLIEMLLLPVVERNIHNMVGDRLS